MAIISGDQVRKEVDPNKGTIKALQVWFNEMRIPTVFKEYEGELRVAFGLLKSDYEQYQHAIQELVPAGIKVDFYPVEHRSRLAGAIPEVTDGKGE